MGISRRLPKSAAGRKRALDKALAKNNSIAAPDRIIIGALATRLAASQGAQTSGMHAVSLAKVAMNGYTKTVNKAFVIGIELIASFFKGMFRIVKKVDDNISAVGYYHIAESNIVAPKMTNYGLVTTWGEYITVGETDRVAAGGTPMSNPTSAEVGTGIDDFNTKLLVHSGLKETFDEAGSALALTNPESDAVIKKTWDTLATNFDEVTKSNQRARLREYGVVFVSDIKKIFTVTILNNTTGLPKEANVELVETGLNRVAGTNGIAVMPSTITAEATFLATSDHFADNQVTVTVSEDILEYSVTIRMTPLI